MNAKTEMKTPEMKTTNIEQLELQAVEQRNHIHDSVEELRSELKSQVSQVKRSLDPALNARKHFAAFAAAASLIGLLSGYKFGGLFTN